MHQITRAAHDYGDRAEQTLVRWFSPAGGAAAVVPGPTRHLGIRLSAAVLVAAVVVMQCVGVVVPRWRPALTSVCLVVLCVTGGLFAVRAARGADRLAWLLVAVGELLTVLADVALGRASSTGSILWFWLGSTCGMAMYAAFALAAAMFPTQQLRGWQRAALIGEAAAVLGCGFMFVWYFVLQPHLQVQFDWSRWPLSVGFPLGDLLLLCA